VKSGMKTVLGMMSGTSMDGVDAAILVTDGETIADFGPRRFRPYSDAERGALRAAVAAARELTDRTARPPVLAEAERIVTEVHTEAATNLMAEARGAGIDLIGFHGQTVFHAPERRLTVQIGDGKALARRLGLPVVYDFRAADISAGGEGAPLVPVYHRALAARAGLEPPVAIVNIGGVANLTWIGPGDRLSAFDTGPGNALIDDLVRARTGHAMDENGALAAAGTVDAVVLSRLMEHPYFVRPAPKSLDRNDFSFDAVEGMALEDAAATLAAFTARTIAAAIAVSGGTKKIVVVGGGARNPTILRMLTEAAEAPVLAADAFGWSADFIEAEAFAFLAARSVAGLPLTYPETTGVPRPMTGGVLATPEARLSPLSPTI
jgi:anhydro-N-acetylmuramic acid kinase